MGAAHQERRRPSAGSLRGNSAGDFREALAALPGKDAPNLSAAVIARLKSE
jgi:putative transposase